MNKHITKIQKIQKQKEFENNKLMLNPEYVEQKCFEKYKNTDGNTKLKIKLNTIKNMKNNNDVILSEDIFENALKDYNIKVVEGKAFGEIFDVDNRHSILNLENISHKIVSIKIKNWIFFKEYICKIKILETPQGKIAEQLIKNKLKLNLHVTASGSYNNHRTIDNTYKILRIDLWFDDSRKYNGWTELGCC